MGAAVLLFAGLALAQTGVPCSADNGDRNGSALCLQLSIQKGRVAVSNAVADHHFVSSAAASFLYEKRKAVADDFFVTAKEEIAALPKPCEFTMTAEQLRVYQRNPKADAAANRLCGGDFSWGEFQAALAQWAASIGRRAQAEQALTESGVFRRLQSISHRTPLLWSQTSAESLDVEHGAMKLLVADPLDPRPRAGGGAPLGIFISGIADDQVEARTVRLRQELADLRNSVFCHERIRERIEAAYRDIGVRATIVQMDSAGGIQIEEAAH